MAMIALGVPIQSQAAEILLKCESTDKQEREIQDWFIRIKGLNVGDAILVTHTYPKGKSEFTYQVVATGDQIGAVRLSKETGEPQHSNMLTLDRLSGHATLNYLVNHSDTATLWNEQKQQFGRYEGDVWLGSQLDCVSTQRAF